MKHEMIEIAPGYNGFLVISDQPDAPSLLLIHEIFGITPYFRELATDYAAQGYNVLVPDLFWRTAPGIELDPSVPEQRDQAMQLNVGYDDAAGMQDLEAAIDLLRSKVARGRKVGAIGYCLGGRLAFRLAASNAVDAAVSFYGVNIHKLLGDMRSSSPLLVHIAGADYLCPLDAQQAISDALAPLPQVEVVQYDGAGHAFARPRSQHFDADAAASSAAVTSDFLARWLGSNPTA
jgi:carboxymethylenebutenolidase